MDGIFGKQRFIKVYNIIGMISGAFLALLFGFFICIGEFSTLEDVIVSYFFVCFGLLVSILCGISLYVNQKVYIHVDDQKISAFCHFGLTLECDLSEVGNISYGYTGLNIQLKNGKKYDLMNLENAYGIAKYIQKRISIQPHSCPCDKVEMLTAIQLLKKKCRSKGIAAICIFVLLFPYIFITSALTGWKELQEFVSNDWIVFTIMAGVGVLIIVVFCVLLRKYLLDAEVLRKMQGTLYQTILQTAPVQPGNAIKLLIDDEIYGSIRVTIYGFPNSEEVYYTVEQVDKNYEIECIQISKIYPNINAIAPEIEDMTEIPIP